MESHLILKLEMRQPGPNKSFSHSDFRTSFNLLKEGKVVSLRFEIVVRETEVCPKVVDARYLCSHYDFNLKRGTPFPLISGTWANKRQSTIHGLLKNIKKIKEKLCFRFARDVMFSAADKKYSVCV